MRSAHAFHATRTAPAAIKATPSQFLQMLVLVAEAAAEQFNSLADKYIGKVKLMFFNNLLRLVPLRVPLVFPILLKN
jgi:hypothetical protein